MKNAFGDIDDQDDVSRKLHSPAKVSHLTAITVLLFATLLIEPGCSNQPAPVAPAPIRVVSLCQHGSPNVAAIRRIIGHALANPEGGDAEQLELSQATQAIASRRESGVTAIYQSLTFKNRQRPPSRKHRYVYLGSTVRIDTVIIIDQNVGRRALLVRTLLPDGKPFWIMMFTDEPEDVCSWLGL
jgi:hypothetical protein